MAKRVAAEGKQNSLVWAQGLACGALAALVPSLAFMVGVLLGPGLLALVVNREPGRPVGRAVLLCGLAACVSPVRALWASGHGIGASLALVEDVAVVGSAWSAAAAGWLLAEIAPIAVRAVLEAISLARAAQLRTARERLTEEWGLPPPDPPSSATAPQP
jgi:hypothetical protein